MNLQVVGVASSFGTVQHLAGQPGRARRGHRVITTLACRARYIDRQVVLGTGSPSSSTSSPDEFRCRARRARAFALAFDRVRVFDDLFRTPIQLLGQAGTMTPLQHHDTEEAAGSADRHRLE